MHLFIYCFTNDLKEECGMHFAPIYMKFSDGNTSYRIATP